MATSKHTAVSGIYVILNTKTNKVYIGKALDIKKRWRQHKYQLNGGYHSNEHLQRAWVKYGAKAFKFQKLEYCSLDELNAREQHHIAIYKARGMCYNLTDGGEGASGRTHTDEARQKISNSLKGHAVSEESRQKMSAAQKGKKMPPKSEETRRKSSIANKGKKPAPISEEGRRKISAANKGRIVSEETRRKISESHKHRAPVSDEARRKMSAAQMGKKHAPVSEETRQKMRDAQKNRDPEIRQKISDTLKGHAVSEETRRKISETKKLRFALKKLEQSE